MPRSKWQTAECRMNRAGQFSFRKFGKGTGKSRFRRNPRRIFPAAQQTPTRICSQTFNEHLGRGQVEFRFQQKRPEKLLTIQFLPSNTTPFHLRCHKPVRADNFHRSPEFASFPVILLQILLPTLEKSPFDVNVMIQLIVHVTPLVWRKMNFQLTFVK